ncbi:hypothetical protein ANCDUO_05962 [Ancylostoma duodenale]|uniref:Uncharacterized protein n=1 Tax=Ancylostoma duodenale TaxID=51022 RepID=A0A0C2D2W2_9BILA|nr:hypothetical protein ANCDUO_05962 [Ancylostoma duodenale]
MVVAKELDDGFDLDKIDAEIKIEKIRQTASKLSWDGFQQALRRNLMVNSCKIGYFGKPPVQCDEAVELVRAGEFGKLRSKIFAVLATVPSNLTV